MFKKRIFIFIIIVVLVGIGSSLLFYNRKEIYIERVLTQKAYAYLSTEAKEYIKDVYEKTGEVILTEKNKEENVPYLNPQYVDYLNLSDEEKQEMSIIPSVYNLDYMYSGSALTEELPSKYDLRNVDGNSYITPLKNQGYSNLCWAFATVENAESFLMIQNGRPYDDNSEKFSARQINYATSKNGIKNYENENGYRILGDGGNYWISSSIMSYGLSLFEADDSDNYYNGKEDEKAKELYEILNYASSSYELNSAIMMPIININDISNEQKKTYIDTVKENIIRYGGPYVGTQSPDGYCGFKNIDDNYVMVDDNNCTGLSGHAMQIIGWDDNYEYSYCKGNKQNLSVDENGECSSGTLISSTGAWILRNSYGDDSDYKYVYLGYLSTGIDINFVTSLSKTNEKNWDNHYQKSIYSDGMNVNKKSDTVIFSKKINSIEKLEKIKFIASSNLGNYTISIETGNNKYDDIKTIDTEYPGIYTIDMSDKNIILDSENFIISIKSNNDAYILINTISAFTSNIDDNPIIKTDDIYTKKVNSDSNYEYIVYSVTKNIPSNSNIIYSLYKNNENYSNYILLTDNNIVAENNINTKLIIDKNIPNGEYKLKTIYGGYSSDTNILISNTSFLEGSGTEDDPYLLYNEEDLNKIRYDLDAYYLLKNDITLTNNWKPIGTKMNPFNGGFDGGNHTINNLVIEEDTDVAVGFFGYVRAKYDYDVQAPIYISYREETYIKNLIIKDAQISNIGNAGILIGQWICDTYDVPENARNEGGPHLTIDSIHFIDSKVTSVNGDAGVLISNIDYTPSNYHPGVLNINNVYSSTMIRGKHSMGLIGFINDQLESATGRMININISNFQNVGILDVATDNIEYSEDNNYSPVIGGIIGNVKLTISNYIINSIFNDLGYNYLFFENNDYFLGNRYATSGSSKYDLSSGYYIRNLDSDKYVSAKNIKDRSLFDSWTDFDKYWKIENINSIKRIPVLKDIDYDYISNIDDISLKAGDRVSLLYCIGENNEFSYINWEIISNENIIKFEPEYLVLKFGERRIQIIKDWNINALNIGEASIHIVNNYDGFEKDLTITVDEREVDEPVEYTIVFDANGGLGIMESLTINSESSILLPNNLFTRNGYVFANWNTKADGSGTSYSDEQEIKLDSNLELYAQWQPIQYKIIFNSNNGSYDMQQQILTYDKSEKLTKNTFTRLNYKFKEWNTKPDGTGVAYTDEQSVINISATQNDIIDLYVQWEPAFDYIINNYEVDETNKYISKIMVNTPINMFTTNFTFGSGYGIDVDYKTINDKQVLYTGGKTRITHGLDLYREYTNIVIGDINGDGAINSADLLKIRQHLIGTSILSGVYFISSDINYDSTINSADLLRVRQHLLGSKPMNRS